MCEPMSVYELRRFVGLSFGRSRQEAYFKSSIKIVRKRKKEKRRIYNKNSAKSFLSINLER